LPVYPDLKKEQIRYISNFLIENLKWKK
jgi:hypothetical protein